jgi:hypothetical protein
VYTSHGMGQNLSIVLDGLVGVVWWFMVTAQTVTQEAEYSCVTNI